MLHRQRRSWSPEEDQLLRDAVEKEDPGNPNPSRWHAIAKHIPNRTNKDCRKRWVSNISSDVAKGGWSTEEDERLSRAIDKYGPRWSLVASMVQTRNSDQCAKRWRDTLNPAIDRTNWSPEADEMLLSAVTQHGKLWTKIVKLYFPGRTGLSAKNRYNSITRSADSSRGSRRSNGLARRREQAERAFSISTCTSTSPSTRASSLSLFPDDVSCSSASSSTSSPNSLSPVTPTMSLAPSVPRKTDLSSPTISDMTPLFEDSLPDLTDILVHSTDPNTEVASTPSSMSDLEELPLDSFLCDNFMSTLNSPTQFPTDLLMSESLSENTNVSTLHLSPFPFDSTPHLFPQDLTVPPQLPSSLLSTSLYSPSDLSSVAPTDFFMSSGKVLPQDKALLDSREDILMRLDTLETMQQKLETQESTLKNQRASLNRIAMVCKIRGEEESAKRYLREASKRKMELSLVLEQQESINDHITSLCGQLERGQLPIPELSP